MPGLLSAGIVTTLVSRDVLTASNAVACIATFARSAVVVNTSRESRTGIKVLF